MRLSVMPSGREFPWFRPVFILLILAHLAIVLVPSILPFTDLPNHLAVATIYKHYADLACQFDTYYSLQPAFQPNTFFPWFCSLPIFPNAELAAKLYYAAYVLLLPLTFLAILRHFGGNPWFSLLSFLFLYSYSVTWGFVGYTMSIPLLFLACHLYLRWRQTGRHRFLFGLSLLLSLMFFFHAQTTLFTLGVLLVHAFYPLSFSRLRETMLPLTVAMLPCLLILLLWVTAGNGFHSRSATADILLRYYSSEYFEYWPRRFLHLWELDNYRIWSGLPGTVLALFFSISTACFAWFSQLGRAPVQQNQIASRLFALLFLSAAAAALILPREIDGHGIIYERFPVFVFLSLILWAGLRCGPGYRPTWRWIAVPLILTLSHAVVWAEYQYTFAQESKPFTEQFLQPTDPSDMLVGMLYDNQFRDRPVYLHFPNYYIIWHHGITSNSFTEYRFGTVRRKVGYDVIPEYHEWIQYRSDYRHLYENMDLILIRGSIPPQAGPCLKSAKLLRVSGPWKLYLRPDSNTPNTHAALVPGSKM